MVPRHKFPNSRVRFLNFAVKLFAVVGKYEQLCIEWNATTKQELQSFILPRFPQHESPPIEESNVHNFLIDKVGFPIEWAYEAYWYSVAIAYHHLHAPER